MPVADSHLLQVPVGVPLIFNQVLKVVSFVPLPHNNDAMCDFTRLMQVYPKGSMLHECTTLATSWRLSSSICTQQTTITHNTWCKLRLLVIPYVHVCSRPTCTLALAIGGSAILLICGDLIRPYIRPYMCVRAGKLCFKQETQTTQTQPNVVIVRVA